MPVYKSIEYAVYCELCGNLIDFEQKDTLADAEKFWRSMDWRRVGEKWICDEHDLLSVDEAIVAIGEKP